MGVDICEKKCGEWVWYMAITVIANVTHILSTVTKNVRKC